MLTGGKIKMVADTGCGQNIISSKLYKEQFKRCPLKHTNKKFVAYGQRYPLKCLGYFEANMTTGMSSIVEHIYVIEGHAESLLGRQCCFDLGVLKQVKFMNTDNASIKISNDKLSSLVKEYDDLFHGLSNITNFTHNINIDPNIKAVSQPLRRIPLSQIEAVSDEIDRMLEDGVIEKSTKPSPWVSNLVVVPKQSGGIRLCCDYRELNKAIIRERHVLPKVEDTLNALCGSRYFAKIDARSGFLQLSLAEDSRHLTTFITNKGCFQFKRVPFGLSDISETFQKVMEEILYGLEGVKISIDDVIVHAYTLDELIVRLRRVFERCRQRNLKLNASKCEFGLTEIKVLGHVITSQGIKPDPAKTEAIRNAPAPKNVSEVKSFLGLCGYVSKFIPHYADLVEPLRVMTRKGVNWLWANEQAQAFDRLKLALSSESVLACFKLGCPTFLITDASPVGLGAVLVQEQCTKELKPVAYISRSLSSTEERYSQIERETLACVWAVERFHNYLFGNEFVLCVDNKPLTSLLAPNCKKILPPRIQRLAWRLYQYNYKIEHVVGEKNIADLLSRLPLSELDETTSGRVADSYIRFVVGFDESERALSFADLRAATAKDKILSVLLNLIQSGTWSADENIKPFRLLRDQLSVYDGIVLRGDRIVVPEVLVKRVLKLAHISHVGMVKTKQNLRQKYFWIGMDKDIESFVQNCEACATTRPLNFNTPLQPVSFPKGPWIKGGVDIVGPIEDKYLVTFIDYYSSFPEVVITRDISAKNIVRILSDIFARHGYPEEIVSDNGP